jgi:hypothetical protein
MQNKILFQTGKAIIVTFTAAILPASTFLMSSQVQAHNTVVVSPPNPTSTPVPVTPPNPSNTPKPTPTMPVTPPNPSNTPKPTPTMPVTPPNPTSTPKPTPKPIPVNHAPVISTWGLPTAILGFHYSATIYGYDMDANDKLKMQISGLPTGLSSKCDTYINNGKPNVKCQISGTPKKAGNWNVSIKLTDNAGHTTTSTMKLSVTRNYFQLPFFGRVAWH